MKNHENELVTNLNRIYSKRPPLKKKDTTQERREKIIGVNYISVCTSK